MSRSWKLWSFICIAWSAIVALWLFQRESRSQSSHTDNTRRSLAFNTREVVKSYWDSASQKSWFHIPGIGSTIHQLKTGAISNNVTFVYVVGAEGSGVSVVTPAVAIIAKTCNQHVIFRDSGMRGNHLRAKSGAYQYFAQSAKKTSYGQANVLIVDDAVFPVDNNLLQSTAQEKKGHIRYNIEWVYDQMTAAGVSTKILYLNRNFYRTVAAQVPPSQNKSAIDVAFQQQARIIHDFIGHIGDEYSRIEAKSSGLWRQLQFEWFTDRDKCTGLVAALIEYLGFDHCDVQYACELFSSNVEPPAPHAMIAANREYAKNLSITLPIPKLNISERDSYAFTTRVSSRKPSAFAFNESYRRPHSRRPMSMSMDRWQNVTSLARNNVSLLYIVGVEGVGHHGVTPAIASIAKTCNYHVLYENSALRKSQAKLLHRSYQSTLNAYKQFDLSSSTNASHSKVLIIEDQSFPTDGEKRNSTAEAKKTSGKYNIEWVFEQARAARVGTKFLYLHRDFYRAVASHPEFDGTFERHAQVLHDFTWYIHSEYEVIERKQPGLWGQVHYEWFANMTNCTALVSAVVEFLQFDYCDVDFACTMLNSTLKQSRKRDVNITEFAYAQQFNTTLPIPVLDITPKDSYQFSTVVSPRKPFTFIKNMTARARFNRRHPKHNTNSTVYNTNINRGSAERTIYNNVSVLYLAGLVGAGQEAVAPAIAHIARSCNYHVVYQSRAVRRAQQRLLSRTLRSILTSFQSTVIPSATKVLLLEDSPFPADPQHWNGTEIQIRKEGMYNLAWMHSRVAEVGADMRVLYLQRDLASVLAAGLMVPPKELTLQRRIQVLGEFNKHLYEEYQRIDEQDPGGWAQVRYDWFTQAQASAGTDASISTSRTSVRTSTSTSASTGTSASATSSTSTSTGTGDRKNNSSAREAVSCTALVAAIARHAGWTGCDIHSACDLISGLNFSAPAQQQDLLFSREEEELIRAANISVPIPLLQM